MAIRVINPIPKTYVSSVFNPGSSQGFKDWVARLAAQEAKKLLDAYVAATQQQQSDAVFIAELNNDLTIAKDPNGYEYTAITVGDISTKYVPFFKLTGDMGVAYSPDVNILNIDGSAKTGMIASRSGNEIYIRELGESKKALVTIVPSDILSTNIQVSFSANLKHLLVGWWYKETEVPYRAYAVYQLFSDFYIIKGGEESTENTFAYKSFQTNNFDLRSYADGKAAPPQQYSEQASYIWYNRPFDAEGDFARFFPVVSSYYDTVTNDYTYQLPPAYPGNQTTDSMTQQGEYSANWYLDPNTLADFQSVRFAFNNDVNGNPKVDIVTSYRAITVGTLLGQNILDDQGWKHNQPISNTYTIIGQQNIDAHYINFNQKTWTYSYTNDYIGEPFTYTSTDTSDPNKRYVETSGSYAQSGFSNPAANFEVRGNLLLYPDISGTFTPYKEVDGGIYSELYLFWYGQFAGTQPLVPILYPPDTTKFFLTTFDGVTKTAKSAANPQGYVAEPQAFAFARPNQTAGLYCYEYSQYNIIPQGPFARDYYFAKITMVIEDATGSQTVKFNNGEPPLTARDYNTIITPYKGVNGSTALCYRQEQYPTDTVFVDPSDDISFQAILDTLRESGLGEIADYLEANASSAASIAVTTKQIYWYCSNYYNYPLYGYDNNYDVITDAVVAPHGTFPFAGQYFKGLDSYIIIGYNGNDSGYESITLYQVAADGNTSISSRARKTKRAAGETVMDVGMKYGSVN